MVETIDMEAALTAVSAVEQHQQASVPALRAAGAVAAASMPPAVVTPSDLLRIAMERDDKDLDRLERLMAMEERYRESQERERQRTAMLASKRDLAAFRGENIIIPKTKHVDRGRAGSFEQAEFDEVCRRLSPALSKHGFGFRHDQKFGSRKWTTDGVESDVPWVYVTCYLEHRDGHTERLDLEGPPGDLSANTPVQNMQATASYLKRVSLLAITGTATGGEDDERHMRSRRDVDGEPDDSIPDYGSGEGNLVTIGYAKAREGMSALTAWWGSLDAKQRGSLNREFGLMRKEARNA
jgi:hypothetical protein